MPHSVRENDADVIQFVRENNIKRVLDVGAGSGTYSRLLRYHLDKIDAVEVWEPYLAEFGLRSLYDNVFVEDVVNIAVLDRPMPDYDLIVFGDVVEHITAENMSAVWAWAGEKARYNLISVPLGHWPQGAVGGNPYEEHVQDHLTHEAVEQAYGPFIHHWIYPQTATFIAERGTK